MPCTLAPLDCHQAAVELLQHLPDPWAPSDARAHQLAELLLAVLADTAWTLSPPLAAYLGAPGPRDVRDPAAFLAARIRRLPDRTPPPPRPSCTRCGSARSLVHGRGLCVPCAMDPTTAPDLIGADT